MLKRTLICLAIVISASSVRAEEYAKILCSDLIDEPNWAAHVVGWLNLQNRDGVTQNVDFIKASEQALSLQKTCTMTPDLALWQAVTLTFGEIEDEGAISAYGRGKTPPNDVVSSIAR